uniref:hypothetical protein n=1 Tax=Flavobacterium sp. TaxID=239 RepID=UPI004047C471
TMPADLAKEFQEEYNLDADYIKHNLYKESNPNAYLATFAKFIIKHKDHPYCKKIIKKELKKFTKNYIMQYENAKDVPVHFIGSIAFYLIDDLTAILNKYDMKTGNIRKPKSQPEDYSSGLTGVLLFGAANPYDQLENYQIGVGKIYKLNPRGTIRANISLGLGYTIIKEPENWIRINNGFLAENYTWNYNRYSTFSVILNPKIEFPFSRFYGLTLSPLVQINKDRTYIGIGVGQMIGLLRKRK